VLFPLYISRAVSSLYVSLRKQTHTYTQKITEVLELDVNNLSGSIPTELYDLSLLTSLQLFNNTQLTGTIDSQRISQLSNLEIFSAGRTQLKGTIPESVYSTLTSMRQFKLEHAQMVGTLSSKLHQWNATLEILWLHGNQLTGPLPTEALGSLTQLKELQFQQNNDLVGTIPQTVCEQRGNRLFELSKLMVDCEIACTCCDDYCS